MKKPTMPLIPELRTQIQITARTLVCQSRIERLERYSRLVNHGLGLLKKETPWWNIAKKLTNWVYKRCYISVTKPRIEKIVKQYRLAMSAPFDQPFNQAELMHEQFIKDHAKSFAVFEQKGDLDTMEM